MAAKLAVVGDVDVGHDPVVIAQAGDAGVLHGAGVDGDELADGVARADFQTGGFACVFLVLRRCANAGELEDAVARANAGAAFNDAVRANAAARANAHMGANDGIGADGDICRQLSRRVNEGGGMNGCHGARLAKA